MAETTIHTHTASESALAVNSYLVETANGVVAVDAQLTVSEATGFRSKLEALGKPLLAVLVTHPHGDHVAGLTHLVGVHETSPTVPILALPAVGEVMRATEDAKRRQWRPVFGEEWVDRWTYPTRSVRDGETVELDGIVYRVHDLGPGGDSDANSVWTIEQGGPRAAFVGDTAFNGTHSYTADGHILPWLVNLEHLEALLAHTTTLYPGHGPAGTPAMLAAQRLYLLTYCAAVKELSGGAPSLSATAKEELTERMETYLPTSPLRFMVELGADPVATELAGPQLRAA